MNSYNNIKLKNIKKIIGIKDKNDLYIEDGTISLNSTNDFFEIDCSECIVSPGFIDPQINGFKECNFWENPDFNLIDKLRIEMAHSGVVAFCPTIITNSKEKILTSINHINSYIKERENNVGAKILGIHIEGYFASKFGIHEKKYACSEITEETVNPFINENVVLFTLAPELDKNGNGINLLKKNNILVSIGHSNGSYEDGLKAIYEYGLDTVTHMFNAMKGIEGFSHRNLNSNLKLLTEKLNDERKVDFKNDGIMLCLLKEKNVLTMVIADNMHVNKEIVRFLKENKSNENFSLVSDLVAFNIFEEAKLKGSLGGGQITIDKCIENIINWNILDVENALLSASYPISRKLKATLNDDLGEIKLNSPANLTIWNTKNNSVKGTIIGKNAFLNY